MVTPPCAPPLAGSAALVGAYGKAERRKRMNLPPLDQHPAAGSSDPTEERPFVPPPGASEAEITEAFERLLKGFQKNSPSDKVDRAKDVEQAPDPSPARPK